MTQFVKLTDNDFEMLLRYLSELGFTYANVYKSDNKELVRIHDEIARQRK